MIKVSIIVPIHNSEKYLPKCISSLLAQTLQEIEIILIDDASTDSSRDKIKQYAKEHPEKIKTILLDENIRQGGARNRGLDIARGEYIAFVDSDDWIEPQMCQALYESANNADMVGANYYIDTNTASTPVLLNYSSNLTFTPPSEKLQYVTNCGLFWGRIYRRDFLQKNNLYFPEKIFYEDAWFNFMTAVYAANIVKVNQHFYHYYQSPDSTVRSRNSPRQYERLAIPDLIMSDCKKRGLYETYHNLIDLKFIYMHMANVRYTCLEQFDRPDWRKLAQIRASVHHNCKKYRRHSFYTEQPLDLRIYFRFAMWSPLLTVFLHKHGLDRWIELWCILFSKLTRRKQK